MTVLRTFILRAPETAVELVRFIKQHAAEALRIKQPLQVTVARYRPRRSTKSNAYYWAAVVEPIAQYVAVGGRYYSPETWHEHAKRLHLPERSASGVEKWVAMPDGTLELGMGTKDLNSEEMGLYIDKVAAWAATELGVEFDAAAREGAS